MSAKHLSPRKIVKRRPGKPVWRNCHACGYAMNVAIAQCPRCHEPQRELKTRARPRPLEDNHQAALFGWIESAKGAHPDLDQLYHVPNGGTRNVHEAIRLKQQGVKNGVLDLNLDVPRDRFHGLRIELKATKAELGYEPQPSPEQVRWINQHRRNGYMAVVCRGWDEARSILLLYLGRAAHPPVDDPEYPVRPSARQPKKPRLAKPTKPTDHSAVDHPTRKQPCPESPTTRS